MAKKKRKTTSPPKIRHQNLSEQAPSVSDFRPDPLVEGDCTLFDNTRVFSVGQTTIQYSFREHYLYFPWENKKSQFYTTACPPASYHLEKRPDLKNFDFFSFIKDSKKVRMYRFALECKICDDLLEYISDDLEAQTILRFRQKIEELRDSRDLTSPEPKLEPRPPPFEPLFPKRSECHFLEIRKVPTDEELMKTSFLDPKLVDFLNWFNSINDPLVAEVNPQSSYRLELSHSRTEEEDLLDLMQSKDHMLKLGSIEDLICVRKLVASLITKYFRKYGTKFKFCLASSPGSGKTYMKYLFSGYNLTDLDDISMLDPQEENLFRKLVAERRWSDQKLEYYRVIRCKFKEGILLAQNSNQVPKELPYLNIITPGHIGEKKLWSDRGLYDLVIKNDFKVFVDSFEIRNKLFQIVYEELFNSLNYP